MDVYGIYGIGFYFKQSPSWAPELSTQPPKYLSAWRPDGETGWGDATGCWIGLGMDQNLCFSAIFGGMHIHLRTVLLWTEEDQGIDPPPFRCIFDTAHSARF